MSTPEAKQEVRAEARWVRISARKARLVTDHIRGRTVPEARTVLAFSERAAAREIEKVLRSAVSNAEANHGMLGDQLLISAAYVDEGPTLKRWRARARGRMNRIRKRSCHITVKLAENPLATAPRPSRAKKGQEPAKAPSRRASAAPAAPTAGAPKADEKPKRPRAPRKRKEEASS